MQRPVFHVLGCKGVCENTHIRVVKVNVELQEHALSCISRMLKAVKVNSVTIWIALIERCRKCRGIRLGDTFISVKKKIIYCFTINRVIVWCYNLNCSTDSRKRRVKSPHIGLKVIVGVPMLRFI